MKWIIALALVAAIAALASAGVFMLRHKPGDDGAQDKRMARALAWRVGVSIALFVFILFAYWMGWITPTGIPMR